jgi:hypothetical protein
VRKKFSQTHNQMKHHQIITTLVAFILFTSLCFAQQPQFTGEYKWSRFQSSLYLCRQEDNVYGSYTKTLNGVEYVFGVLEGKVDKKNVFSGVFVDVAGVSGPITLQLKENNTISGEYWLSKKIVGGNGVKVTGEYIANTTPDRCFTTVGDKSLSGTWNYGNNQTGTWCVNGNTAVGDNAINVDVPSVSRGQVFLNGRVWAGVWVDNDHDATFANRKLGAFLKIRLTDNAVHEIQYYVTDGDYSNSNTSNWEYAQQAIITRESDDFGTCVSEQNRLAWMGIFDITPTVQLSLCYTSGKTISGSITSTTSNGDKQLRGAVHGRLSKDNKEWKGVWYDVTDKSPYYGHFDVSITNNLSNFTGIRYIGETGNNTVAWSGVRSNNLTYFASDEECKLAASSPSWFEGTWTSTQPSILNQDYKQWTICLVPTETNQTISFASQKDSLDGIIDKHEAIARGNNEKVRVISVVRRIDNLLESHYWTNSYLGSSLDQKLSDARPANNTCFAIAPKDNVLAVSLAVAIPVGFVILLAVLLLVFFLFHKLVKKSSYQPI